MSFDNQRIDYGNIRVTPESISKLYGGRIVLSVPRHKILAMTSTSSRKLDRPFRRIFFGLPMLAIGVIVVAWILYHWLFIEGGTGPPEELLVPAVFLGLIGYWVFIGAFQRIPYPYLLIKTDTGMRKLPLKGCLASEVLVAAKDLGYPVYYTVN